MQPETLTQKAKNEDSITADLLSENDLARQLGEPGRPMSKRTLKRWNSLRIGPPRIKVGRKVFYRRAAVEEWLRSLEEPGAGKGRRRRSVAA